MSAEIGKQRDKGHDGVRAWFTELQMDEEPVSIPEFLETFTKMRFRTIMQCRADAERQC